MDESIEVNEKYSNNWKPTLYTSLAIAAVTFVIFLYLDNVLWAGIFRLTAFISFSLSIFCMLKVMEGRKTFRISVRNGSLHISYLKNNEVLQTEKLKKEQIESVYKTPFHFKLPIADYRFSLANNCNFKVRFRDQEKDMSLFKFGGRALTIDEEESYKLERFFKDHNLYSKP